MPGPIEESLRRFTPSLGDLNRDELLFAAGRASARPGRQWPTLAALLALTQALTLALLWLNAPPPLTIPPPAPIVPSEPAPTAPLVSRDWRSALEDRPESGTDDLVPDEPPLHVFSAWTQIPIQ